MSDSSTKRVAGMDRRTVVRAGAWTAPVVAVGVAAPAYACSPLNSLVLGSFTANYRNYLNAGTVEPTLIDVTSTVNNTGSKPTSTYTRTLRIPGNLFDTVTSSTPTGYGAPSITGDLTTGWTLLYTRTNALAANGTDTFNVVLTVGNTTATPFRGWQGPAFTLSGEVSGGATCNALNHTDPVEASADTTLTIGSWAAVRDTAKNSDTNLWVGTATVNGAASAYVDNTGRKAVGPITLEVTVPKNTSGRFQSVSPLVPRDIADGWEFVGRTPTDNTLGPWTYTFRTTPSSGPTTRFFAPSGLSTTVAQYRTPLFRARILLAGNDGNNPPANITAVAKATGASTSATATDLA